MATSTTASSTPAPPPPSPWLHALVANVQDAIVLLDAGGRVVFESPSACEILGIPPDDVLGGFGIDRIHPDERDAVIQSFERTIAVPGSVARATYRFHRADGNWQHLEAVAKNLIDDPELRGVLITFRDVTERVRALEAAERAARTRDAFLTRMGEQLRPPLNAILGWTELLGSTGGAETEGTAQQIRTAGHYLLRLIQEAMELAAVQEGRLSIKIEPVDIPTLVTEAVEEMGPVAAGRDVRLQAADEAPRPAGVFADRERLRQVLLHLLSNAIRYNRYAGDVRIHWERLTPRCWRLYVSDTGPGMPREKLHRVFERFERLGMEAAGVEGGGLGLAMSMRLVEMMGGTMGVESRPGEGAAFWLELPAT